MGVPHILIDRHPETDAEEDHIEIQARPRTDLQGELPAPDLCKGTVREI
jgi:hypothetical protein